MERPIIRIDEEKCNGCGKCILDCAEGALAIVNGKAKLISEVYCDGLGACLNCPQGALSLHMQEAPPFDEQAALAALQKRKTDCAAPQNLQPLTIGKKPEQIDSHGNLQSKLQTWPIQLTLMPPKASYLEGAHLLLAAHCSGFALPDMDKNWLAGRVPVIACPKLEDNKMLLEKLSAILANNKISSITALRMSVPCCAGIARIAEQAIGGSKIPLHTHIVKL